MNILKNIAIGKAFFRLTFRLFHADLQIRDVVCRQRWSAQNANIFRHCRLRRRFENEEFGGNLLLGDSDYNIKPYVMSF